MIRLNLTPVVNRSLHTWHNMLRLLCHVLWLETDGNDHKCEGRLIQEAKNLNAKGKLIIPIIDDAHLVPIEALRKLRLLLEEDLSAVCVPCHQAQHPCKLLKEWESGREHFRNPFG